MSVMLLHILPGYCILHYFDKLLKRLALENIIVRIYVSNEQNNALISGTSAYMYKPPYFSHACSYDTVIDDIYGPGRRNWNVLFYSK